MGFLATLEMTSLSDDLGGEGVGGGEAAAYPLPKKGNCVSFRPRHRRG